MLPKRRTPRWLGKRDAKLKKMEKYDAERQGGENQTNEALHKLAASELAILRCRRFT